MFNKTHTCTALLLAAAVPATALADFSFYLGVGGGGARIERDDINLDYQVLTNNLLPTQTPPDDPFFTVSDPQGSDFGWKVFGGVRYGANLGLEVGYIDMGEADDGFDYVIPALDGFRPRPETDRQIDVVTEIDGVTISAIGFLPVGERFELFGKAGVIRWDRKTQVLHRSLEFTPVQQPFVPDTLLYTGGRDPITGEPLAPLVTSGEGQNGFACFPTPIPDGEGGAALRQPEAGCSDLLPKASDSGTDLALGFGVNIKASENVALRAEFEWFDIKGTDLAWAATMSIVFGF